MENGFEAGKKESRRPDGGHGAVRQEIMVALDQGGGSRGRSPRRDVSTGRSVDGAPWSCEALVKY